MVDPGARKNFSTLVAAALVDGELAEKERQVLHRRATEMNIPLGLMNEMIDQGRKGKLSMAIPASDEAKQELFNQLIEIACADGRVEAPEYHLLAKFGAHLGLALPDLRARVKQHIERQGPRQTRIEPRIEPPRIRPESSPPAPLRPPTDREARPEPGRPSPKDSPAMIPQAPPMPSPPSTPLATYPPGPIWLEKKAGDPRIADIPPITLQLLKQAIMFETEGDALRYIERTLGIARPEAEKVRDALLAAFPDLKAGSHKLKTGRK